MLNKYLRYFLGLSLAIAAASAQQPGPSAGAAAYESRCVLCHGGDGSGSDRAPAILDYIGANPPEQIAAIIRKGVPDKGMPPFEMPADELAQLVSYLKTLPGTARRGTSPDRPRQGGGVPGEGRHGEAPVSRPGNAKLADGRTLEGTILNESGFDMQLRTSDGKIHRLTRQGDTYREAPLDPKRNWPSYHGRFDGNRHSPLDQINTGNVARLAPQWFFPVSGGRFVEGTPAVVDGIIYVTAVNQVYALDAATGREIWRYVRPRSEGLMGDGGLGLNRGVSIDGDRLFTVTDNAHIIALDRFTGSLLWDTEMADTLTITTEPRPRRSWWEISSSQAFPEVTRDCAASSMPTTSRQASGPGAFGQSPVPESWDLRLGAMIRRFSSGAAALPG